MAHATTGWCCLAGDESHYGLGHLLLHELGCFLLIGAADLADHDDSSRIGIALERSKTVDEVGSVDRIATDTDAGCLTQSRARHLIDELVGERSGAAHEADRSRRTDAAWNDSHLGFPWRDKPGTVGPEQSDTLLLHERIDKRHVEYGHAFGDADHELDSRVGGFHHRVRRAHRRHVDDAGVGAGFAHCVINGVEHRHRVLELLAALARSHAGNDVRAVLHHLLGVERSVASCDSLHDELGVVVDEDTHAAFPVASATAFFTASSMSVIALNPFSVRIFTAISSLVPVRRMTMGTLSGFALVAVTIPFATSSVRVMPPKMLNRIAFTLGSLVMILSALTTFSGLLEPPMSRKFAGSPP